MGTGQHPPRSPPLTVLARRSHGICPRQRRVFPQERATGNAGGGEEPQTVGRRPHLVGDMKPALYCVANVRWLRRLSTRCCHSSLACDVWLSHKQCTSHKESIDNQWCVHLELSSPVVRKYSVSRQMETPADFLHAVPGTSWTHCRCGVLCETTNRAS